MGLFTELQRNKNNLMVKLKYTQNILSKIRKRLKRKNSIISFFVGKGEKNPEGYSTKCQHKLQQGGRFMDGFWLFLLRHIFQIKNKHTL